jgi:hypothetical protein
MKQGPKNFVQDTPTEVEAKFFVELLDSTDRHQFFQLHKSDVLHPNRSSLGMLDEASTFSHTPTHLLEGLTTSQISCFLFGVTCILLFSLLELHRFFTSTVLSSSSPSAHPISSNFKDEKPRENEDIEAHKIPSSSSSVLGLIDRKLVRALTELSFIMFYYFLCDRIHLFPSGNKHYDFDFFWFLWLLLTIIAAFSFKMSLPSLPTPSSSPSTNEKKKEEGVKPLQRDQTEEWKGWMQLMFLMYHYFNAASIYNAIRIFIAAYVWMTGFGNFSYYYIRDDFCFPRFCQMMWRLNFLGKWKFLLVFRGGRDRREGKTFQALHRLFHLPSSGFDLSSSQQRVHVILHLSTSYSILSFGLGNYENWSPTQQIQSHFSETQTRNYFPSCLLRLEQLYSLRLGL